MRAARRSSSDHPPAASCQLVAWILSSFQVDCARKVVVPFEGRLVVQASYLLSLGPEIQAGSQHQNRTKVRGMGSLCFKNEIKLWPSGPSWPAGWRNRRCAVLHERPSIASLRRALLCAIPAFARRYSAPVVIPRRHFEPRRSRGSGNPTRRDAWMTEISRSATQRPEIELAKPYALAIV